MARYALRVALLALVVTLGRAAVSESILRRYNVASTDVLGLRLNQLMLRIPEFTDPVASSTAGTTSPKKTYPILSVDPTSGRATSSIIVFHGMDSNPEQLVLLGIIARSRLPNTRFVIPRAPVADVTYLRRKATSWFDVFKRAPGHENRTELRAAATGVSHLIAEEKRLHGIPSNRTFVLGMSQGGAVALTFYLAEEIKVAGVIGASTWLPMPQVWNVSTLAAANARTKLLMLHGARDPVIRIAEARSSVENLRNLGRTVQFIEYPRGGHTLSEASIKVATDLVTFVKAQLGSV